MIYSMLKAQQLSFPLIKAFSEEKMRLWMLLGCVQSKQNIKKISLIAVLHVNGIEPAAQGETCEAEIRTPTGV